MVRDYYTWQYIIWRMLLLTLPAPSQSSPKEESQRQGLRTGLFFPPTIYRSAEQWWLGKRGLLLQLFIITLLLRITFISVLLRIACITIIIVLPRPVGFIHVIQDRLNIAF